MKNMLSIMLLAIMVCCWSCSGGEDVPAPTPTPEANKVEISTSAPVVEQKGGTATVSFTTNAAWTASVSASTSWLSVSPASGSAGTHTLTITTTENDTYDERNASITIKAGNASKNITVTQKQKDALILTSNKVEIGAEGGEFTIEAKANVSVTYEIEESAKEWISAGESRALTTKTLKFNAKANENTKRRQGNITLKGGDGLTETITIYQEGEEVSLVLTTEKDMTIGSEGGTLKIELESNTEIKMEGLEADWLRQTSSRSMSAYTYYIEVDANETYDERNAAITFTSGDKQQIVTITQKQKDALIVTSNKVEIGADGGEFTIETKANVSVTYEIEESAKEWISAGESRALTTKTLKFQAKANEQKESRQGIITLKGRDGLTETVTIYQEGEKPTLVITSNDVIVGSNGETIKIELKSNVDYEMVLPNVDWISKEESRTISAYTHYLTIAPNESYDQRDAMVYVNNEAEGLKDSISITQLQLDAIIVAKNEYEIASEGGQLEFKVSSNVDFEVSTSADWMKQNTGSRGLVEKTLSFTIEENEAKESRSGEIIVTYGELKQTIKVNQQGVPDYESIERAILTEFYHSTNGDNWKRNDNWCSDKPLSEWYGIKISSGRVRILNLSDNRLAGTIPESIGSLTDLKEINLSNNQLSGSIPESIGNLAKLMTLSFSKNQLSGSIPEAIGNLSELIWLYLDNNQLSGSIPESIGNMVKLADLIIYNNKLSGSIPESIGNLAKLRTLALHRNQLTGSIPESIGNLSKLTGLYLDENRLSGSIPESIGNLSELIVLIINHNQLSGSIPESIGNLTKLTSLVLHYNQLSGSIPEFIGSLTDLKEINLAHNQLSGSIPESIGNLSKLTSLELYLNQLSGSIPESIGNLSALTSLSIYNNQLSGSIPEGIMKMENWPNIWNRILLQQGEGFSQEGLVIPAPKFSLKTNDGRILDDRIYSENEYTILYHIRMNDKPFMTTDLVDIYKKYRHKGVEVLAFNENASSTDFYDKYIQTFNTKWPYLLLRVNGGVNTFLAYYNNWPSAVDVVDKNGNIVYNHCQHSFFDLEAFLVEKLGKSDVVDKEDYYTSTDYSRDGEVVTLQTATQGQGINLTFMGEAFVDKDMGTGGLYEQKMKEGMEMFFSIEPYKSLRDRFNVYAVKVVSPNAEWTNDAVHGIKGNTAKVVRYAQKIPNADKNEPMVTVIYNTSNLIERSECYMFDGGFVSYIMEEVNAPVLIHESGGHGFAKLLDEYTSIEAPLPKEKQIYLDNVWEKNSYGANVDWRSDATTVKWSHFLKDSRYANEGLGIYEGAFLYGYGAYRPTEHSVMRHHFVAPYFNAPSREQIYKRVMQLSEGENWKYDYEEFVKFDEKNRNAASRSAIQPLTEAEQQEYIKNHRPPTIIKGTWRDAMKGKGKVVVPLR